MNLFEADYLWQEATKDTLSPHALLLYWSLLRAADKTGIVAGGLAQFGYVGSSNTLGKKAKELEEAGYIAREPLNRWRIIRQAGAKEESESEVQAKRPVNKVVEVVQAIREDVIAELSDFPKSHEYYEEIQRWISSDIVSNMQLKSMIESKPGIRADVARTIIKDKLAFFVQTNEEARRWRKKNPSFGKALFRLFRSAALDKQGNYQAYIVGGNGSKKEDPKGRIPDRYQEVR